MNDSGMDVFFSCDETRFTGFGHVSHNEKYQAFRLVSVEQKIKTDVVNQRN